MTQKAIQRLGGGELPRSQHPKLPAHFAIHRFPIRLFLPAWDFLFAKRMRWHLIGCFHQAARSHTQGYIIPFFPLLR